MKKKDQTDRAIDSVGVLNTVWQNPPLTHEYMKNIYKYKYIEQQRIK